MAFPTTGILDSFNRANEGPPPSASWSTGVFTGGAGNGLKVVSNTCMASGANASGWWNLAQYGNSEVYFTVVDYGNADNSLYIRLGDPGEPSGLFDGYQAVFSELNNRCRIFRWDDGSDTQLGADISLTLLDGDQLGLSFVGSDVSLYQNGVLVDTRTDATYTSGFIGVREDGLLNVLDAFGGGTVVSVSTGLAWIRA